jgi:hypothetical protein
MHDPKFEQEVQQKMAELDFTPSESVWANVEAAIKRRRRWRLPLFWRFALPGLLLLAGGGYYLFRGFPAAVTPETSATASGASNLRSTTNPSTATSPSTAPSGSGSVASNSKNDASNPNSIAPSANITSSNTNKTSSPANNSTLHTNDQKLQSNNSISAATGRPREGSVVATTLAKRGTGTNRAHTPDPFAAPGKGENAGSADGSRTSKGDVNRGTSMGDVNQVNTQGTSKGDMNPTVTRRTTGELTDPKNDGDARQMNEEAANTAKAGDNNTKNSQVAGRGAAFNPALASLHSALSPVKAGKLQSKSTISTVQTLSRQRNPWEAAFAGGVGISSLHQMKLANYGLMQSDLPASQTTTNAITTYAARPTKEYVSTVDPGPAFYFGVLARKRLSPRWNFSVGLDFHYYSNRVHVGQQVSGYTPSTATYLNAMAVAPIQSYPYYSRGDDQSYMNRYYFLELPVAIEWRINRSHLLPLFLDGGISASYLVGSSAVYYNTHSGVYFRDAGVANRAQFNLNTALMVGLPVRGISLQLGPQIQYGLTPLLNTEVSGSQHIFYGGLRLVVTPGKK